MLDAPGRIRQPASYAYWWLVDVDPGEASNAVAERKGEMESDCPHGWRMSLEMLMAWTKLRLR